MNLKILRNVSHNETDCSGHPQHPEADRLIHDALAGPTIATEIPAAV